MGIPVAILIASAVMIGLVVVPQPPAPSPATVAIEFPNSRNMFAIEKWVTQGVDRAQEELLMERFGLHREDMRVLPKGMKEGGTYELKIECTEEGFLEGGDAVRETIPVLKDSSGELMPHRVVLQVRRDVLRSRSDKRPVSLKIQVTYGNRVILGRTEEFSFIGRQRVPQTQLPCRKCSARQGPGANACIDCGGNGVLTVPWQFAALVSPEADPIKKAREGYVRVERELPDALEHELARRWARQAPAEDAVGLKDASMKLIKVFLMFREIDRYGLKYQNLSGGSDAGRPSQECRTVSEVLETKSGNCIELTVTLLSLVESVGNDGAGRAFEPYILCPTGHAIAAIGGAGGSILIESTQMALSDDEASQIYERVRDDPEVQVIEEALDAVGLKELSHDKSWPRYWACISAGRRFEEGDFKSAVPITLLRLGFGVTSIDSRK